MKAGLFRYKASILDTPEYYKYKVSKDNFRNTIEDMEAKHGCLIDTDKVRCLPKPAVDYIAVADEIDIDVSAIVVADEISSSRFWVIHENRSKLRIPIAIFVSLTNHRKDPLKIDLLYLEAKSVGGWADIRMADTLFPSAHTMDEKPLVFEAKNACASMKRGISAALFI